MSNWHIPRRAFLRGLGTAMALPLLDCMMPSLGKSVMAATGGAAAAAKPPTRMAFIYIPNGVNMALWRPETAGTDYELTPTLAALKPHQKDINIISGLANRNAFGLGDGGGDHARGFSSFLTTAHPRHTAGADIKLGISVDQVAANAIGDQTRFSSLQLSCDKGQEAGSCDSGYSCAYQFNISWRSETQPMYAELEPKVVFDRLFGGGSQSESAEARAKRDQNDQSILDFVRDNAKQLQQKLGTTDKRKLDEYFTAIRELERQISKNGIAPPTIPDASLPNFNADYTFERHVRLMFDMMTLAFQTDTTRVVTFVIAHEQSNRPYPFIGVGQGHHHISHHGNKPASLASLAKIDTFHTEQFAYFLSKMKSVKEGSGTLLDNSMILYGSGISDGNQHNHDNLPIVLAGRGGGTVSTGRHIVIDGATNNDKYKLQGSASPAVGSSTPIANLYTSMLNRMGVAADSFGDSNGKLEVIS